MFDKSCSRKISCCRDWNRRWFIIYAVASQFDSLVGQKGPSLQFCLQESQSKVPCIMSYILLRLNWGYFFGFFSWGFTLSCHALRLMEWMTACPMARGFHWLLGHGPRDQVLIRKADGCEQRKIRLGSRTHLWVCAGLIFSPPPWLREQPPLRELVLPSTSTAAPSRNFWC